MDARAIARAQAREQARQRAQDLERRFRAANPFPPELVQQIEEGNHDVKTLTSIDATHFSSCSGAEFKIWEKTPEGVWALKKNKKPGMAATLSCTNQGKLVLGGNLPENKVVIYKLDTNYTKLENLWVQGAYESPGYDTFDNHILSVCSVGPSLFVGSTREIYEYDLARQFPGRRGVASSPPLKRTLEGHVSDVIGLCDAEGDLVSGARDGTIKLWRGGACVKTMGFPDYATGVMRDLCYLGSRRIAGGFHSGAIYVWNLDWEGEPHRLLYEKPEEERRWERNPIAVLCHLGGDILAAVNGRTIRIWNVETQVCLKTLVNAPATRAIFSLLYLGNGGLVAGMERGRIEIWNVSAILGLGVQGARPLPANNVNFTWNLSQIPHPVLGNIRIVPRMTIDPDTEEEERTTDALTGDEIEDGMAMTDFQRDAGRTEFDVGKYYMKTTVDQLMRSGGRHPETRQPITGIVQYTASIPTPAGNLLGLSEPVVQPLAPDAYPAFAEGNIASLAAGVEITRQENIERERVRQVELARERERANRERVNLAFQNMTTGGTRRRRRHRTRLSLSQRRR